MTLSMVLGLPISTVSFRKRYFMGLRDTLTGAVSGLLLEQPLKNKDIAEIAQELDLAG